VRVADRPLIANMIVERLPVVTPAPEAWEVEYQSWSAERRAKFLRELPEDLVDPKGEFEELQDPEESKFVPHDGGGCVGRHEDAASEIGSVSVLGRPRRGDETVGLPERS
jgi:hypothetical protein